MKAIITRCETSMNYDRWSYVVTLELDVLGFNQSSAGELDAFRASLMPGRVVTSLGLSAAPECPKPEAGLQGMILAMPRMFNFDE